MLELLGRPLAFTALVALTFVPLEQLLPRAHARVRGAYAADLAYATLGQVAVHGVVTFVLGALLAWLPLAPPLFVQVSSLGLRKVLDVVTGLVVVELVGYGYHRLAHRVAWLRRLHGVHHSSPCLDWLASFRQHPVELILLTLLQNAPLVLLGIPLTAHATVLALLRLHTVFVHANLRVALGPLELLVATPRFHHVHHTRTGEGTNFAGLLPLLDVLFGTHAGNMSSVLSPERFVDERTHAAHAPAGLVLSQGADRSVREPDPLRGQDRRSE